MTDLAQREPLAERGQLQMTYYIVRAIASAGASGVVSFGFSSPEYGGTFDFSLSLPQYASLTLALALLGLWPLLRLKDVGDVPHTSMVDQFRALFARFELDGVWRVVLFLFCVNFFTNLHNNTFYDIASQWCHVAPWVEGLFGSILANLLYAAGVIVTRRYLLNVSWHTTLRYSIVIMSLLAYVPCILIDLNLVRSQWFFAGAPLLNQLAYGIFSITSCVCAVEIAAPGHEGITYGFVTTVGNLAGPFASLVSSQLSTLFNLYEPSTK